MFLKVDTRSSVPLFVQIVEQIKLQVASGRLKPGDRIPTVRDLAVELKVNPNTVAKAYRELERESILEGRPGQGSFIGDSDAGWSIERRREMVSRTMEQPIVQAYHLKLSSIEVTRIFETKRDEIFPLEPLAGKRGEIS